MLDYGYRSKCCHAPIKFGQKIVKNTGYRKTIIICTKCRSRDVPIISKADLKMQGT